MRSLYRMSKAYSKKKFLVEAAARTKKQAARAVAGVYAKYQFGFAPLVRSVQDAIDANVNYMTHNALAPQLEATRQKMSSLGSSRHTSATSNLVISTSVSGLGTFFYDAETTLLLEREVRCGLYKTRISPVSKREYLGLTASDIPQTAWELFPLSFLVDRLINIKRWTSVSRLMLNSKVEFRGGWMITTTRNTRVEKARWIGATGKSSSRPSTPPRIIETYSMSRSAWSPNLSDVLPPQSGTGLLSSLSKTTDVASIAILRLTGRGSK